MSRGTIYFIILFVICYFSIKNTNIFILAYVIMSIGCTIIDILLTILENSKKPK